MGSGHLYSFDDWTFDATTGALEHAGERIALQDLPARLFAALLESPGELVTREQLIGRLWPGGVIDFETGLNTAARKLRTALNDDADAPRYLETIPRRGYRFIGRLAMPAQVPPAPANEPGSVAAPPAQSSRPGIWIAVLLLSVSAIAAGVYVATRTPRMSSAQQAQSNTLRLAVLPFENLSPDPANAFFADGLHEEVVSALATRASNLEVISRTTMLSYRAAPTTVQVIARDLSVTHVLEGSVRREGSHVRLMLQLIDARNDAHVWSQSFDRELIDTMSLQAAVAADVAEQLAVRFSGSADELPRSASAEAYDRYLKAHLLMQAASAARSLDQQREAQKLLDDALALDPEFGAAHLERARVRMHKFVSSRDLSTENLALARADLAAAREFLGESPPLLISQARYALLVDFDSKRAARLLATAAAMNPNSAELEVERARGASAVLDTAAARRHFERAVYLDPGNPEIVADWATFLKLANLPEQSLRVSRDFDARYPGRITYGRRLFSFTGETARLQSEVELLAEITDAALQLTTRFDLLLYEGRYAELAPLLDQARLATIPQVSFSGLTLPAVGTKPVAELRGWTALLMRDAAGAAAAGRDLQQFVAHEPQTRWNGWYLHMLAAEGALFAGDSATAIEEARTALALAPRNVHVGIQRHAPSLVARVLAWAGAHDDAVALLETASRSFPVMGPAEITRDPLYAVPLAGHAGYRALERRLEAAIAENRKAWQRL